MRAKWPLLLLAIGAAVACATGQTGDDDDDDASGGQAGAGGASTGTATGTAMGGGTSTGAGTTTGTGAGTSTGTTTTGTGSGSNGSCYAGFGDCNPMQTDCTVAGAACDIADDDQFHCFDPPPANDVPEGGYCDVSVGPFCQNGLTCVEDSCMRFCCIPADCAGDCVSVGMAGAVEIKVCG